MAVIINFDIKSRRKRRHFDIKSQRNDSCLIFKKRREFSAVDVSSTIGPTGGAKNGDVVHKVTRKMYLKTIDFF